MRAFRAVATVVAALAVSAIIHGCGHTKTSNNGARGGAVHVTVADRAAYDELIAKHRGKVILVDFWATWCGSCVEQFPHTVALSKRFDPTMLAVVSVSMDEPDDREEVLEFLQEKDAAFDNLISKYGIGQEGFKAFGITDGAIPHYKIYDRSGKLRRAANSNDGTEWLVERLVNEQ